MPKIPTNPRDIADELTHFVSLTPCERATLALARTLQLYFGEWH